MPLTHQDRERIEKGTQVRLEPVRCVSAHIETCVADIISRNGLPINDPNSDVIIKAKIMCRNFTTPTWVSRGKGAGRMDLKVILDLENGQILSKDGVPLNFINTKEILDGVYRHISGGDREIPAINPSKVPDPGLKGGLGN